MREITYTLQGDWVSVPPGVDVRSLTMPGDHILPCRGITKVVNNSDGVVRLYGPSDVVHGMVLKPGDFFLFVPTTKDP